MGILSDGSYTVPRTEWRQSPEPSTSDSTEGEWWYKVSTDEVYYFQDGSWVLLGSGGGNGGGGGTPGDTGTFGGGFVNGVVNYIDYITISTTGDVSDFGDLTSKKYCSSGASNGTNDRGLYIAGYEEGHVSNTIDYVTISSPSNASDFGDTTISIYANAGCSNGTDDRGINGGGASSNVIDYVTISSTGDATDFGDLTVARSQLGSTSNGTNDRGIFIAGISGSYLNTIDYITISSTGDATDFGDCQGTYAGYTSGGFAATSNDTNDRGVYGGVRDSGSSFLNTIEYVTITSTGNATDFGDTTVEAAGRAGVSNGTNERGVFGGGWDSNYVDVMDYITISTTGNASDFGDLRQRYSLAGVDNGLT